MRKNPCATLSVDLLESRAMLSGFAFAPTDASVVADLAKIQTDSTALFRELRTLTPTLAADGSAISTAILSATKTDSAVETAQSTLKTETTTTQTTIAADLAVYSAATTSNARQAASVKLQTDTTTFHAAIQADEMAVQMALNVDPGVAAAVARFNTDAAPLTADAMTLRADIVQYDTDLQA
jgi:hypothetical protein